jgi:hypothetical protein
MNSETNISNMQAEQATKGVLIIDLPDALWARKPTSFSRIRLGQPRHNETLKTKKEAPAN